MIEVPKDALFNAMDKNQSHFTTYLMFLVKQKEVQNMALSLEESIQVEGHLISVSSGIKVLEAHAIFGVR